MQTCLLSQKASRRRSRDPEILALIFDSNEG